MNDDFICPISPNDPPARILIYLEDAEIDIILSMRNAFPEGLQAEIHPRKILFIEDIDKEITETDSPQEQIPINLLRSYTHRDQRANQRV